VTTKALLFGILVVGIWLAVRPNIQTQAAIGGGGFGGGVGLGCSNGSFPNCADVNGDGQVDLSDPIFTLVWLFTGGPEPKCCADTAQGPADWVANQAIPIPGRRSLGRFVDNGDGTVTDNLTGLQWQQRTGDWNRDGVIDDKDSLNLENAKIYMRSLTLAGKSDWRLPTQRELQSIVDRTVYHPSIDPIFTDTLSDYYWSPEDRAGDDCRSIHFYLGDLSCTSQCYVLLVRNP
jgi:uncharacterized protein DUF1566